MNKVFIVSAVRTPIGSFGGMFANISATNLGAFAIKGALEKANVSWFLSLDNNDLPKSATDNNLSTFRSITIDEEEIEFSGGFTDLHTLSYKNILEGNGFGIEDARSSIEIAHTIRNQELSSDRFDLHPFVKK